MPCVTESERRALDVTVAGAPTCRTFSLGAVLAAAARRLCAQGFAGAAAASLLLGCGAEEPARPRAVVIGIDSADWTIIDQLVEAGDLPNLAALQRRGVRGALETLTSIPLSPVVWTSIATGKGPAKHGVTWFLVDQPDGTRTPVRSTNRKTEALWTILDRAGRSTCSVGWWATYPAEPLQHGLIVSDAVGVHGFGATAQRGSNEGKVSPSGAFEKFDGMMPPEHQVAHAFVKRFVDISAEDFARERFDPARSQSPEPFNPIHLFQQYAATATGYTEIGRSLLADDDYDLCLLYFEQVDSLSHLFMKYEPPRLPWAEQRGVDRYSRTVREWYRHQDEILGVLLAEIDLGTTAVFLVSDHGFKTGDRRIRGDGTVDPERAHLDHESAGIFLAAGPQIRRGARIEGASVLDITPTVLHYLGLPVGKDMDGRVLTECLEEDLTSERAVRYVTTHETGQPRASLPLATDAAAPHGAEAGLRALGYMGDGGDSDEQSSAPNAAAGSSPEIHNNLGFIHLGRGELSAAVAEFNRALKLDPGNAGALLALSEVLMAQGKDAAAALLVERALSFHPNAAPVLARLAEIRVQTGQTDEALALYVQALELSDSDPALYVGYGDALQRSGRLPEALAAFHGALGLNPDDVTARYNLGVTLDQMGRAGEAAASYERALQIDPQHPTVPNSLNNLGAIARARGDKEDAIAFYDRAAAASPSHLESRFNAAMLHLEAGRLSVAIERLEEAADLSPTHEQVHQQLGLAYLRSGRLDDAKRALMLVRRLNLNDWVAPAGLSVIHERLGQPEAAKQSLELATRLNGKATAALVESLKER